MKKYIPLLIIAIALFSCDSTNATKNPLYEDLILPDTKGAFRGVEFNMSQAEVVEIEKERKTVKIYDDESKDKFVITSQMGPETLNFADITYDFDDKGLYGISVETYAKSLEEATEVFDLIVAKYTKIYGAPNQAEDGFVEFAAESDGKKFDIAVKNITDLENSFGMYMYYDIVE